MSSLLLLNASPRGTRSNSLRMVERVGEGWVRAGGATPETLHLARSSEFDTAVEAFGVADTVLIAMPLYTDSMPALVKDYIEKLERYVGRAGNPRLGFLVQSGFTEALHSRPLERYLAKLADRLGCEYAGTIVRGNGEALQAMPDEALGRLFERLRVLGESLAGDGIFDTETLEKVAGTERFSVVTAAIMSMAIKTIPATQFYWNSQLKRNDAWEERFAAPYGRAAN